MCRCSAAASSPAPRGARSRTWGCHISARNSNINSSNSNSNSSNSNRNSNSNSNNSNSNSSTSNSNSNISARNVCLNFFKCYFVVYWQLLIDICYCN